MSGELKACPFCGAAANATPEHRPTRMAEHVMCLGCGAELDGPGSIDQWNTRSHVSPGITAVAELVIGQTYTSKLGFGLMTYLGETQDIDGWLPTFRARDGRCKAYSHDRIKEIFEEFPANPLTHK